MLATTTLGQFKDLMYGVMNETSGNRTYTNNGRDTAKINDVIKRVSSGYFKSALNPNTVFKSGDIPYLRKKQYFKYKEPVACSVAVVVGVTTITIDTTNFTTTGSIYSQGVVISYTGKSATQLTGCTGVVADFDVGTKFEQVYALNANTDKPYRMFKMYDGEENEIFEVKSADDRFQRESYRGFTVLYDETSGNRFVRVFGFNDQDRFLLKYYSTVAKLASDTDISIFPDDYVNVISTIAGGELLMESQSEDAEYVNKLTLGYSYLIEMYDRFTVAVKDMDKIAKARPYNFTSVMPGPGNKSRYTNSGFRIY